MTSLDPVRHPARPLALALVGTVAAVGVLGLVRWYQLGATLHDGAAWWDFLLLVGLALLAWIGLALWTRQQARAVAAAEAAAAQRAYLAALEAQVDEAVIGADARLRVTSWNPAAERIYGWTAAEAVGRTELDLFGSSHAPGSTVESLRDRAAAAAGARLEYRRRRKDGTEVDVEVQVTALRDGGGALTGFVGIHRDVTEARRAREALLNREAQLRLITSRIPAGVFIADATGANAWVNQGYETLTGHPAEALLGTGWTSIIHGDDLEQFRARAAAVFGGLAERATADLRIVRADGEVRFVHIVAMPLEARPGASWIGVLLDVTEERRLSERAARAERLAGLGTLAGGMAHRINNPLAALLASIRFALYELRTAGVERLAETAEALREAEEDGRRIAAIVKDLESFAAPTQAGGLHDLREVVREALRIAAPDLETRARVALSLEPLPLVAGERSDLRQLLLHLVRNAWKGLPEGRPSVHLVTIETGTDERGWARLEVRDDGAGLTPEQARLSLGPFDPDQPDPSGRRLGLAVCGGVVASLGGSIELTGGPGGGTAVRVALPPARKAPRGAEAEAEAEEATAG